MGKDLEEPLVVRKKPGVMYPNCPGCKFVLQHQQGEDDGPPVKELAVIALLVVCNTLPIASLFPFIYFMVEDFHIAKNKDDIGFYVGALGSAFMVGRFLTSVLWGMAADKYGRKPVMIIGVASVIIFGTGFGCSTNFWFALAMRFLLGGFNGMLATTKAYATEICSEKYQALGVSIVGTMWGLGLVIGPALGGYLSQPAVKYPSYFPQGSLFDRYPYLLPSVCSSVFAVVVFIKCFQLPETLHKHHGVEPIEEPERGHSETYHGSLPPLNVPQRRLTEDYGSRSSVNMCEGIDSPVSPSPARTPFGSFKTSFNKFQRSASGRSTPGASPCYPVDDSISGDVSKWRRGGSIHEADEGFIPSNMNEIIVPAHELEEDKTAVQEVSRPHASEACEKDIMLPLLRDTEDLKEKSSWLLCDRALMGSIAVYCFWSLQDIAYTEIFSLWCVSPKVKDGLGFNTSDVGTLLALSGFGMLVFQLLFFPMVANFLGPILTTRIGAALSIPLLAVLPFFPLMQGRTLWVLLCVTSVLRFILSVTTLTGSFILVNNSTAQAQRGAANGLAMSLASLFKAIGPEGGGAIFAWAQRRQDAYILPGNNVVFFFLGAISLLTVMSTLEPILPRSTNHPFVEEYC